VQKKPTIARALIFLWKKSAPSNVILDKTGNHRILRTAIGDHLFLIIVVVQKRSVIQTFFLQPLMPQFLISEHNYEKRYNLFCELIGTGFAYSKYPDWF